MSLPDIETLDQIGVALRVLRFEVIEQPAAAPDEHQQPAAGMVILCVRFEMFRQVVDAFAENRDLDFRRSRVGVVRLVTDNQFGLAIFGQRHAVYLHERPRRSNRGTQYLDGRDRDTPYGRKICYSNKLNMLHQNDRGMQKPPRICRGFADAKELPRLVE